MSDNALVVQPDKASIIENVMIGGDLAKLTPDQRVSYYRQVCDSLGLNPLTRPFEYITLNGKLTLYARKDASEQLRRINKISIEKPDITFQDEWIIVTVAGSTPDGRKDSDIGVVSKKDMRGDFGNAVMKAVTKAKRRLTLSICGLGMLDETEVETIPDARPLPQVRVEPVPPVYDLPDQDGPAPIAYNAAPMTLEQAQDVKNRDGVRYGDITTDKLSHMANSLAKIAARSQEQEDKLLAVQLIISQRNTEAS